MAAKQNFVGVDDGHYAVKVVTEDGQYFSFPSRARAGRHLIAWQGGENNFYTAEEGVSYTVSDGLADTEDTRFSDFPRHPLNRVLVHHALAKSGFGDKDVVIATGLPVSYYYVGGKPNEILIAAKSENLSKKVVSDSGPLARIVRNDVTTEAIAAYFDQIIGMDGQPTEVYEQISEASVGVIDIGGKTTDCAVIMPGGAHVDDARSGSKDIGVLMLNDAVESELRAKFQLDVIPPALIERAVMNGIARISGKDHDVSDIVNRQKEALAEKIMSVVRSTIGAGRDLEWILFVGGGSLVMKEQLAKYFEHARFPDRPEYANARGMLKIAKYVNGA
jgi:plasmid segregation protein ParM